MQVELEKVQGRDDEQNLTQAFPKGCIYSFDAGKLDGEEYQHIIQCDISKVPLPVNSLDIAVFSLSLMGTNYIDFLIEANRVLKNKGILLVAEVLSRFSDVNFFADTLMRKAGFRKVKV